MALSRLCGAACAAVLLAGPALAETGAECLLTMARAETETRIAFENGLVEIVSDVAPDHADLAGRSRDLQVLLAQDRLDRVAYLTGAHPEAFADEAGGVPWSEADEEGYMAEPGHAARMERIAALGEALEADPSRAELQEVFAKVVTRLFEFQKLMADHNAARRDAAAAFTACRGG